MSEYMNGDETPIPSRFRIVPAEQYPLELAGAIDGAEARVALQAMVMRVDEGTAPIFEALSRTVTDPDRDVDVTVLPDAYSRLFDDNVLAHPLTRAGREARHNARYLQSRLGTLSMQGAGAEFIHPYVWPPRMLRDLNPLAGRNHAKVDVVDNHVFSFGGTNKGARYFRAIDYMLHLQDAGTADFLYDYTQELLRYGRIPGDESYRTHQIDDNSKVLLNIGRPGESVIYEAACRLSATAAEVMVVTQYPPKGEFRDILANQQRYLKKENMYIFHNKPGQFRMPGAALRYLEDKQPPRLTTYGSADGRFIHAKAILVRMRNGEKWTLTGSDNFQASLKKMGTAEIALLSRDPQLYYGLRSYLTSLLIPKVSES